MCTTPTQRLYQAAKMSERAHDGQYRKGLVHGVKVPYATHPARVASRLLEVGASVDLAVVGLLHDVLEDTKLTAAEIEASFGPVVRELVEELTNDPVALAEVGKTAYLAQKMLLVSPEAVLVKLADRADNASDLWKRKTEGEETGNAALVATVQEYLKGSKAMLDAVRTRKDCSTAAHHALAHAIDVFCEMAH